MKKTIICLTLVLVFVLASKAERRLPEVQELDGDPVLTLLPPDGIPSIDQPKFVPGSQAKFMKKNEPVIGVVHNGVAKAYSVWHLDRHEIVNDTFGSTALAVTW